MRINEPGAYLEIETGHLYRIPKEALNPRSSPLIKKVTIEPCRLARISEDPFIERLQALVICYEHRLRPHF